MNTWTSIGAQQSAITPAGNGYKGMIHEDKPDSFRAGEAAFQKRFFRAGARIGWMRFPEGKEGEV